MWQNENINQFVSSSFIESEFSVMSEEECDILFEKSIYISSGEENDKWDDLDSLNQKRNFLYSFWKAKRSFTQYHHRMELNENTFSDVNMQINIFHLN